MNLLNHFKSHWRNYLPAVGALGFGLLFLAIPAFAVFILSGLFFTFGLFYAWVVFRFHQLREQSDAQAGNPPGFDFGGMSEPTFRNVTIRMSRQTGMFKDLN